MVDFVPFLAPSMSMGLLLVMMCICLLMKKRGDSYDVTTAGQGGAVSLPEDSPHDRFPPHYSTVDQPPPYSLIDPKLTIIRPDSPPPPYEMFSISLPLDPHHRSTPPPCPQAAPPC